ncbi:carbohydrate kinase family protein [Pseudomonas luteola]|uniref:carbohydrate kinase family protein n=1 Tax=Pseudomonas luteola TaxID=47886 RepID=UPI0015E48163|nr:carbohydrate kinase [Pseudomonas zeshuii]MBA1247409.1 carbohydrate kinase [Pseudomonas zeshuii]
MTLPRVVVFGEALTDLVQHSPGQWQGHPGGAPWNVARTLARLGVPAAFAGSISQDSLGDEIHEQSQVSGLDMRFLQRVEADPLVAVVPSSNPPRYFFAGEADLAFDPDALPHGWLEAAELCHFSCISLAREPLASKLLEQAEKAKAAGKRISYDPNWRNLMGDDYCRRIFPTLVRLADDIKLSDEDLENIYPGLTPEQGLSRLRDMNPEANILYTQGAKGITLLSSQGEWTQPGIPIHVADTVGAGDACMAGWLASGIISSASLEERLLFAAACASVSCQKSGAYAPTLDDVRAMMATSPLPA